ncbi:chalcone isomerase family protein [Ferrimonas senticii]|uniref:chalcone isomerase family protein n=1 Tax=Ferrimonas senticii TaxID=394566 RepID=UPI0003FDD059|nr:chalcone isomerase family protein [Ferrimonas senticii]
MWQSMARALLLAAATALPLLPLLASATEVEPQRPATTSQLAPLQLVGQTKLKILWFSIYRAKLYTPSGRFEGVQAPLYLELNYLRDIDADELLDHTAKEWRKLGQVSDAQASHWLAKLKAIWPNIRDGDQLLFALTTHSGAFYYNGNFIGDLTDPSFGPAFAAIWLDENASYPKSRRQLVGR